MKELIRFRQFINEAPTPDIMRYTFTFYGKRNTPFFGKYITAMVFTKFEEDEEKAKLMALQNFKDKYDINLFFPPVKTGSQGLNSQNRPEWLALPGTVEINKPNELVNPEKTYKYWNVEGGETETEKEVANIDPNQTIFAVNFREKGDDGEVGLYVAVDTEREARRLAKQYMVDGYESPFKLVDSRNLGTFDDLDPFGEKDADLWKGNIADFGYA
jgi:hypothetical protein